jgi:hypothetical protein
MKILSGLKKELPTRSTNDLGELLYTEDTNDLYIIGEDGNKVLLNGYIQGVVGSIPTIGLYLDYSFDNISGSTIIDSSGNSNNTLSLGGSFIDGGSFISTTTFKGTTDPSYFIIPNSWYGNAKDFSISFWFDGTIPTSNDYFLGLDANKGIRIQDNGNVFRFDFNNTSATITPEYPFTVAQWNHVVVTKESLTVKIYLDSVLIDTITLPDDLQDISNCYLGARGTIAQSYLGAFDVFRIYDIALTPEEITALYEEV